MSLEVSKKTALQSFPLLSAIQIITLGKTALIRFGRFARLFRYKGKKDVRPVENRYINSGIGGWCRNKKGASNNNISTSCEGY